MTIREAAKHIGMSVGFLRRCVCSRRVPFARIGTKALRFRREDLDRWFDASGSGGEVKLPQEVKARESTARPNSIQGKGGRMINASS